MTISTQLPESLWRATASKALESSPLLDSIDTDITIIGGGFTGLSAALHLSEWGYKVVLLEAVEVGFGGSGRNGGQIIPGIKMSLQKLINHYGQERAENIVRSTNQSANLVYSLVEKYTIDCDIRHKGFIQPAFSMKALKSIEHRCKEHSALGAPVTMIDQKQTTTYLGMDAYYGALYDEDGGSIQPLSYARGLARSSMSLGVQIFEQSPVTSVTQVSDKYIISTEHGQVTSNALIIATNAYGDIKRQHETIKGLAQSVIPVNSFQIATTPINKSILKTILPQGQVVADTRRLLNYFQIDAHGRLLLGGRGGIRDAKSKAEYSHIVKRLRELYPQLSKQSIEFYWSGRVALTLDTKPQIHQLSQNAYVGQGFNGRGVGMATLMGKWLAEIICNKGSEQERLPLTNFKPIPFLHLRKPMIHTVSKFKGLMDKYER